MKRAERKSSYQWGDQSRRTGCGTEVCWMDSTLDLAVGVDVDVCQWEERLEWRAIGGPWFGREGRSLP